MSNTIDVTVGRTTRGDWHEVTHETVWKREIPAIGTLYVAKDGSYYAWHIDTGGRTPIGTAADLETAMCAAEDVMLGLLLRAGLKLARDKEQRELGIRRGLGFEVP